MDRAEGALLVAEHALREARQAADAVLNSSPIPGPPGPQGPPGEKGLGIPGERGRDGRDGLQGSPGSVGERGLAGPEGPVGPQGPIGAKGDPGEPAYPGRACGLWSETESYRAMDVVAQNGSEWRAVKDDPGPLPGDGWVLGAKGSRGKPGDRGEKGDCGPKGDRGPAGLSVIRADMVGFELVLTLSDETRLVCNMLGAFERYHREAVA